MILTPLTTLNNNSKINYKVCFHANHMTANITYVHVLQTFKAESTVIHKLGEKTVTANFLSVVVGYNLKTLISTLRLLIRIHTECNVYIYD